MKKVSLSNRFGFKFYSILLIVIDTKIRLHFAAVCPSDPCIIQELPVLFFPQLPPTSVVLALSSGYSGHCKPIL